MSNLQQIFPFNNALVRRFFNWKQGDEQDDWRNKAIDMLMKKLRRQSDSEYANLQIVLERKTEDTPCISISRSQDGRLQVSHRKMLPHVMYCRIFRWPDLQSQHELKSVPSCAYPASRREATKICVNPYHYTRVDHSIYPPVVTPRGSEYIDSSPPPQSPMSPGSNYSAASPSSPTSYFSATGNPPASHLTPVPQPPRHQPYQALPFGHENDPHNFLNTFPANPPQPTQQNQIMGGNYYASNEYPLSESNWFSSSNDMNTLNGSLMGSGIGLDEGKVNWCRISYAELNQMVGEPFHGRSSSVTVDGYTLSIQGRRFSLGALSNVNRNRTIEMTRNAIGKGVCLRREDSKIYVTNMSEASIFFHSKNHNAAEQLGPQTVVKIRSQSKHKIFDYNVFDSLVQDAIASEGSQIYERLRSLYDHCTIKMSFVKGWGSTYQRQDVTSTPCWIEIHLTEPHELIGQYLERSGGFSGQITSTS